MFVFKGFRMDKIEFIRAVLSCVQLFVTCGTGVGLIYAFLKFAHKPADKQSDRIAELEKRADDMDDWKEEIERRLHEGVEHFRSLDEDSKVTQQALLAIMDNALGTDDGREQLKNARNMLYEHLSAR